jgi:membrane peptidoglycan carboxypeptidase
VRSGDIVTKTGIVGRLISISAVGGMIVAAMALPVVATTGVILRDQANKAAAPASATFGTLPQRSEILDNSGHLLAYIYDVNGGKGASASGIDRQPVTFDQIAPVMRKAVVAIEDNRYWSEGALDPKGTLRALVNDLQHKPVQGGSSITQQYVKNMLILTAPNAQQAQQAYEETLSRKLHELRLAISVAHQQSKQEILSGYLNDAYFGNLAYGIDVAAQTYFDTSPGKLTLPQAATLAGMVENPTGYDPYLHPTQALQRRNTVLARMVQTGVLSSKDAQAAEKAPLGVTHAMPQNGCTQDVAGDAAFFCNYVEQVFLQDTTVAKTASARAKLLATGGLKVYTTLDPEDQKAAAEAVNYTLPYHSSTYNAFHEADTETMVQPGTGKIEAMAENRPYGPDGTTINYAVDTNYGGGQGVQTGSSSKLFTLVTALEQNIPFGYTATVPDSTTVQGYTNCKGQSLPGGFQVQNDENSSSGSSTYSLYTATALSINVFYGELEQKVGLCNVVKTAANLGVTWADGTPLLKAPPGRGNVSADNITSFTLGSVVTSPLDMAGAYATMAARGKYCAPIAISKITSLTGASLPVPSAGCRQAISPQIADAVNYILQGVLNFPGATGAGLGLNVPAAGKTGTANNSFYAAFGGYTPDLAAYVSVYHPNPPESMTGAGACYHASGQGQACDSEMFGADAPGHTWQLSFEHANLGKGPGFVGVPSDSQFNSQGDGQSVKQQGGGKGKGKGKGKGNGGGGNGNGNGNGGTTACFFNFCTGGGNNGGGGGVNGGPPANATKTALITPSTTGMTSPLALFAREE